MSDPTPSPSPSSAVSPPNPLAAASSFLHHHLSRLASQLAAPVPQSASLSLALAHDEVAHTLIGTPVFTVCNSNNEFVLVSDPATGLRSLGFLCFRSEDADALLSHVRTRQPVLGRGARVVPITLDQVYMLKAEGLTAFDGVPVFQSDLLVVKKQKKRFCPIYFQKVGSLEDVLKKILMRDSGWDDLIFIPPGRASTSISMRAEMCMLRWIYGNRRRNRVQNDDIRERLGVAPIKEKLV